MEFIFKSSNTTIKMHKQLKHSELGDNFKFKMYLNLEKIYMKICQSITSEPMTRTKLIFLYFHNELMNTKLL